MNSIRYASAVIVAAGQSTRMGANKMLLEIGSMTVFERTVRAFEESPLNNEIIIVSSEENIARYGEIVREGLISKVKAIVRGGSSRCESVRIGLGECKADTDIIAVHDGARPLIKPESISEIVLAANKYGAAAAGNRSKDTVKLIDEEDFAVDTVDRERVVLIQTPQAFRRDIIMQAHEKAALDGFEGTDDCSLTERTGVKTKIIYLPYVNLKLTDPTDVSLVKTVLKERGKL